MEISIIQEHESDYDAVYTINATAFGQENEAKLVDLLRKSDAFIPELSLVATRDDRVVGHILFTKITIVGERGESHGSLALAPMAVAPGFQKQGIGGKLIQAGLTIAKTLDYSSVIVLGHEHYYPKFGFAPAQRWQIKCPVDVPSEVFMGIELVTGGLSGVSGTVRYSKVFENV